MLKILFSTLFLNIFLLTSCQKSSTACCLQNQECLLFCNDLSSEYEKARKQDLVQCSDELEKALEVCFLQFPQKTGVSFFQCQLSAWETHNICWQSGELKFREGKAEVEQCLEDCTNKYQTCNQ